MFTIVLARCGSCHAAFDAHIFGLSSRLGPPIAKCLRCGEKTETGRAEWPALGQSGQRRFVRTTLIYACVFGCIGATLLFAVAQMRRGQYPDNDASHFADPVFQQLAVACAASVLVLQGVRLAQSVKRAAVPQPAELPLAFSFAPDLIFAVQMKLLLVALIIYLGAKALYHP